MSAFSPTLRLLPAVLAALLACTPAWADKDDHGGGKHGHKHGDKHERKADKHERKADKHEHKSHKHDRHDRDDRGGRNEQVRIEHGRYFSDDHRNSVRTYYSSHRHDRSCPPGLAKKNNGCMPPGQAKKWRVGERAPVGYVVLPQPMLIQLHLPPPPPSHRYVRIGGDILLIALGTQMVVDGIDGMLGN